MIAKLLNRRKVHPEIPTFTGVKQMDEIHAQLFTYDVDQYAENENYLISDFKGFSPDGVNSWLNVYGIHEPQLIKGVCKELHVHDLVIQDILDVNQRPKFQEYEHYCFFTLKSIVPSDDELFEHEQLSFILGDNYLVSFQEKKGDFFNHIRERIRKNIGIVRDRKSDYLLFLLLESILDNYFKALNDIESSIENDIRVDIDTDPSPMVIKKAEQLKRKVHKIKKTIFPIKEFVTKVERENIKFISERHIKYFLELKDLCLSLIDECEQIEVSLESNINLFFSVQGHRMNQVMKTLTIVATIFIPLTFVAGIYGMNFDYMPELKWDWGYFIVWFLMGLIFISMVLYFKRKRWF